MWFIIEEEPERWEHGKIGLYLPRIGVLSYKGYVYRVRSIKGENRRLGRYFWQENRCRPNEPHLKAEKQLPDRGNCVMMIAQGAQAGE